MYVLLPGAAQGTWRWYCGFPDNDLAAAQGDHQKEEATSWAQEFSSDREQAG